MHVMEDHAAVAHGDAMIVPQFGDADLSEWLSAALSPPRSPEKIVHQQAWLCLLDHGTHKLELEDKSDSVTGDEGIIGKQHLDYEKVDYIVVPSLLDLLPMQGSWGGQNKRSCRKRRTSWRAQISYLFGLHKPFASLATKFGSRKKNNKHWTPLEAKKLVKGLSEYGVGKWVAVKRAYFKRSFRKAVHLKDKWRDLLRACGIHVGSKRKVQAQKATLQIVKGLKDEIINLHRKHDAQRKRQSR
ncbi:unnamed protein product [Urochloa decumbens]|uniref:Myb-like domain-containing protein n=1 Tax=Urochloa decumbens TaxID=240449 RepID=A0ABC8XEG9_9POAL